MISRAKIFLIVLTVSFITMNTTVTALSHTVPGKEAVLKQADQWVQQLSQASEFKTWQNATLTVFPLGPGTHSWMVVVENKNEQTGYLIVHATSEGNLQLGEYGFGAYISQTGASSQASKVSLLYNHPFSAVAIHQSRVYDMFLLEELPFDLEQFNKKFKKKSGFINSYASLDVMPQQLEESYASLPFDPYEKITWLTSEPLTVKHTNHSDWDDADLYSLAIALQNAVYQKLEPRFITEQYNNEVMFVWSVIGYHKWDQQLYIQLHSSGTEPVDRFIPFSLLIESGKFYF